MEIIITYSLVGVCVVLMILINVTDSMTKKRKRLLFLMTLAPMLLMIADRLAYNFNGTPGPTGGFIVRSSKFLAYGLNLTIIFVFSQYLKDILLTEGGLKTLPKSLKNVEYILMAGALMLVISQIFGIYYIYDENNVYKRQPGYPGSYIFAFMALIILIYTIIRNRKNLRKRLFVPLLLFTGMPIITSMVHFFIHWYTLTSGSIVAMTVLLYCFSILDANEIVRTANEKDRIMVSQTTSALAEAIDAKDSYTNGHSRRVAEYSVMIAKRAGKSETECDEIYLIAQLHDVGKIGIPDAIINKAGKLTDAEFGIIKTHPVVGSEILSKIDIAPNLGVGARWHHERYDGKGYPDGLKGEEIPEIARIIAVADSYDAMASKRSYRDALPQYKIRSEFQEGIGTQFDPKFAKIMIEIINEDVDYQLREN